MLSQHIIDQLRPYDFDRLAHQEKDGRRRLRLNRAGAPQGRQEANRCYDGYKQIVDAWNAFTQIPGAIRSLCSRSWAVLPSAFVTS